MDHRRFLSRRAALLLAAAAPFPAQAAESRFFRASDGARLHYLETGQGRPMVLVPGWSMPAWIWEAQLRGLAAHHRVIAFDPRGQGESDITATGYEPERRGRDIGDLLDQLRAPQAVIVGWSLGVLDTLAYLHGAGDARIAGLVLVDNSIGEDPPPTPPPPPRPGQPKPPREPRDVAMRRFVRGMFRQPPPQPVLDRLTADALRLPPAASRALLSYPVPRGYWRDAIYSTRPAGPLRGPAALRGAAANLAAHHPSAETAVFAEAGHALFADEPQRFNRLVLDFIRRKVWP